MKSFFNTNRERGSELEQSRSKALTQQEMIIAYMRTKPSKAFTPFDIKEAVLPNAPITSVRRAITNLTDDGWLIKTTSTVIETYGKRNHLWTINKSRFAINNQMEMF